MGKKKRTCVFAFGNQKGGVGKSTLTALFGNYLHQVHGERYEFQAVDGDDLQGTLYATRMRDFGIEENGNPSKMNDEMVRLAKEYKVHQILRVEAKSIMDQFENHYNGSIDFLGIDLPGNVGQVGVLQAYVPVDVLFVPCNPNFAEIDATQAFLTYYENMVDVERKTVTYPGPCEKYMLVSRLDRKLPFNAKEYADSFPGLPVLNNVFPLASAAFGRDVVSMGRYKKNERDIETERLFEEIFMILENAYRKLNS